MGVLRFIILASLYTWNFSSKKNGGNVIEAYEKVFQIYMIEDDKEISKQYNVYNCREE